MLSIGSGATVLGRVVDETGAPVPQFKIRGDRFDDPDGRFRLSGLTGSLEARISAELHMPGQIGPLALEPGAEVDLGTFVLTRDAP